MKRRSNGTSIRPRFFFLPPFVGRHAFVERLLEHILQYIKPLYPYSTIQQSNAFLPLNKPAVGTAAQSIPLCRCADMQSCRHNSKEYYARLVKRERQKQAADTAAGFWETKRHSSLGCFLHALLRSC
ncbi:MAG: hypothetical protein PUK70_08415 [Bacteroidales bacterium]|nr:hypothetical protein [Bacteroidales bacterium]MDY6000737.1 hypothetical protein [Candidatus Cryptobacteroides sp.]